MRPLPILALALVTACGANADQGTWDPYDLSNAPGTSTRGVDDVRTEQTGLLALDEAATAGGRPRAERQAGAFAAATATESVSEPHPAPPPGLDPGEPLLVSNGEVPSLERDAARTLPLLIYTGDVVLAIYDVDATKAAVVDLAERLGGYAAQRTDQTVVIRVPAERFRAALDAIGELGDVLRVNWAAQDVTDQFNDLEVRLANARRMRERLEELLDEARNVPDALAIERELERVTLEIERLEGQRRQMVDRIAFATITVSFSRIAVTDVPGQEYRLPFQWLDQLGVERLLSL